MSDDNFETEMKAVLVELAENVDGMSPNDIAVAIAEIIMNAMDVEREYCAKIAENESFNCMAGEIWIANRIASSIRSRSQKGEGK